MFRQWVLLAACCGLVGCSGGGQGSGDPVEFDLYEAAIRQVATGPAVDDKGVKVVYYVSIDGTEPAGLFARFQGATPAVEPASNYRKDDPKIAAQLVSVQQEVQWLSSDKPRVFLLSHRAGESLKCGTPWPIALRRQDGKWVADVK